MGDLEIHIKRRFDSRQTLCTEEDLMPMDPIHVHRALTIVSIVVPDIKTKHVTVLESNCAKCLCALQKHLLTIAMVINLRVGALNEAVLVALDEHIMKLRYGDDAANAKLCEDEQRVSAHNRIGGGK